MKIKLRKFKLSDLEEVMKIEKVSFLRREVFSKSLFERYYKEYPEGFLVAKNENEVVGYAIGKPNNDRAQIISLAVKPGWRQKGIGTRLTNSLIKHFKERGIKEISLSVRTKNKIAISFYQNLNFQTLKTIKNYYRNNEDAYLMRKEL